ncbi:UNVERIFIED_ORG: hypothetical protein B2H98_06590 [Clostridium botulinum]|uniref:hypothetical protein n=2 Tax=Clostridiaceae TaxID=31979 RepID=UPI0002DAF2D0|nr:MULTISPECIES: hypothetical protein [Clostridium]MBY6837960.1 hypothetical protein [Clostridium botulinum]NFG63813.1 hypothetical protein [Clostridium botulinum]NFQ24960.1 hypothetical protein [Clostridium botulinum]NFS28736.1 hypothetical protein [Clostridium botulinum]NFS55215.1 hypothetical protein [Clostridium botulinum]
MQKVKEWSLSWEEIKFLLFNKKRCRICGIKMKKITSEEYIGIKKWGVFNTPSDREAYEIKFFYYCTKCDKKYSLEELASKN